MPEEQKENVKEVIQPDKGETTSGSEPSSNENVEENRPKSADHNWKEVREIMNYQKHKIAELEEKLNKTSKKSPPEEEDLLNLADDDIITVGDTKRIVQKMAKQVASSIVDEKEKKKAFEDVPTQFQDYKDVVKLADEYVKENPAAEAAIMNSPNPRLTAYYMIKSSKLYDSHMNNKQVAEKVVENSKKPGSSQGVGSSSPLNESQTYQKMTKKRAMEIRKLSEDYASRR